MNKALGMLVALAIFAAVPAVAFGQGTSPSGGGGTVSSGNTQTGMLNQSASGGNAGNQGAIVQQNAGRDANAAVNQTQNFSSNAMSANRALRVRRFPSNVARSNAVRSYSARSYNAPYSSAYNTQLAYTGFPAWVVALLGGAALLGATGLLVMQRRGRLSA